MKFKKYIACAVTSAILAGAFAGCTFFDKQDSESSSESVTTAETPTETEQVTTSAAEESSETETTTVTDGGNSDNAEYMYYKVTVSGDSYYNENGEITFNDLIGEVSSLDENYIVEIIDDNASLKAYELLTTSLYDISVPYMEEDGEIHR